MHLVIRCGGPGSKNQVLVVSPEGRDQHGAFSFASGDNLPCFEPCMMTQPVNSDRLLWPTRGRRSRSWGRASPALSLLWRCRSIAICSLSLCRRQLYK